MLRRRSICFVFFFVICLYDMKLRNLTQTSYVRVFCFLEINTARLAWNFVFYGILSSCNHTIHIFHVHQFKRRENFSPISIWDSPENRYSYFICKTSSSKRCKRPVFFIVDFLYKTSANLIFLFFFFLQSDSFRIKRGICNANRFQVKFVV